MAVTTRKSVVLLSSSPRLDPSSNHHQHHIQSCERKGSGDHRASATPRSLPPSTATSRHGSYPVRPSPNFSSVWSSPCPSCRSLNDHEQRPLPSSESLDRNLSSLMRHCSRSSRAGARVTRGAGGLFGGRYPWVTTALVVVIALCSMNDQSLFCADAVSAGEHHSCTVFDDGTVKASSCCLQLLVDFAPWARFPVSFCFADSVFF